jgi:hypothetical protein
LQNAGDHLDQSFGIHFQGLPAEGPLGPAEVDCRPDEQDGECFGVPAAGSVLVELAVQDLRAELVAGLCELGPKSLAQGGDAGALLLDERGDGLITRDLGEQVAEYQDGLGMQVAER